MNTTFLFDLKSCFDFDFNTSIRKLQTRIKLFTSSVFLRRLNDHFAGRSFAPRRPNNYSVHRTTIPWAERLFRGLDDYFVSWTFIPLAK